MQLDLRSPENSWRHQLCKLGYHYDSEESDDGEETWKKDTDTPDGPKTISTCTVETDTNLITSNEPDFMFLNHKDGQRVMIDLDELMEVDGIRL